MSEKEKKEKEVQAEVTEEVVAEETETQEAAAEEKAATGNKKEKAPKPPKKTKAEVNREMKAAIASENDSRKDRNRAEKAARREIKAARKEAQVIEEKKNHMSNGLLALLIFGVIALMFVSVWAIKYFQKDTSIEAYMEANGGKEAYSSIQLSDEQTMSVTADKNNMSIVLDINCENGKEDEEYYKSDEGVDQIKFMAAYYLGTMKPHVRGISAKADCVVNVNGKEVTTAEVKWKDVDDILEKNGIDLADLSGEHNHEHEHEHEE